MPQVYLHNIVFSSLQKEMLEFQQAFVKYDADFEYGAELPEIFLK